MCWKIQKIENGKRELAALYILEKITWEGFWIKTRNFERSFYNATCIDCVRFVRKDKFLEIGGFDETLTGSEDWDFDRRIKEMGKVSIVNLPIYHNKGLFNLKRYINKKAEKKLRWELKIKFKDLVSIMVEADSKFLKNNRNFLYER